METTEKVQIRVIAMKATDCCCVILRKVRPKDLKILHYVRSFANAQDDGNAFVYCSACNVC